VRTKCLAATLLAGVILAACGTSSQIASPPTKLAKAEVALCHVLDKTIHTPGTVTRSDLASLSYSVTHIHGHYFEGLNHGIDQVVRNFAADPRARDFFIATLRRMQRDCSKAGH